MPSSARARGSGATPDIADAFARIAARRLTAQRLIGRPAASVEAVVESLVAVQSQDYIGAKWAIAQRMAGTTDSDLDAAFDAGVILRTHVLRPTWHFVLPQDIRWLQRLTAPRVRRLMAYYDRQLGVDAPLRKRVRHLLEKTLEGTSLTRAEIGVEFGRAGIVAKGQRLGHLLMHAELDGLICSGPMRGKQFTYALLDERAPVTRERTLEEALSELAQRFVAGHGPATTADFAWWSGLTQADAKRGFEAANLTAEPIGAQTYWRVAGTAPRRTSVPRVHLLPNYDELLIAFKRRETMVHPGVRGGPRTGIPFAHQVTLDGRLIGGWKRQQSRGAAVAVVTPFAPLDGEVRAALEAAVSRWGAFLGIPALLDLRSLRAVRKAPGRARPVP